MTADQLPMTEPERRCQVCRRVYEPEIGQLVEACPACRPRVEAQLRAIGTDPGLPFGREAS